MPASSFLHCSCRTLLKAQTVSLTLWFRQTPYWCLNWSNQITHHCCTYLSSWTEALLSVYPCFEPQGRPFINCLCHYHYCDVISMTTFYDNYVCVILSQSHASTCVHQACDKLTGKETEEYVCVFVWLSGVASSSVFVNWINVLPVCSFVVKTTGKYSIFP